MNIKKIILYNFIKKKLPPSLKKILRPVKKFLRPAINKRELFTFLFKYSPSLLNKFMIYTKLSKLHQRLMKYECF